MHFMRFGCWLLVVVIWLIGNESRAQSLRYQWNPKQKFSYDMAVTVEEGDRIVLLKGIIHYTVESADAEQLRITYNGGLPESVKLKPRSRSGGLPFGPSFGPPRGLTAIPPTPFSNPTFAGKTITSNRISLTPTGRVLLLEGESQLPYLLGNVSLLPFEMLPKGAEREWTLDSGVSISEEQESRRPFGAFGPRGVFGPFANKSKSVQAASEITRYSIQSENEKLVTIKKSYQLTSSAAGDGDSFDMNGSGIWTFDTEEHVPHGLDANYKLVVRESNSSTTYPIHVKFSRLTEADLAKMEAETKKAREDHERKLAEEKAKAEKPLSDEEKQHVLAALTDKNRVLTEATAVLAELATKSPPVPDPEIVKAITRLIKHPDKQVSEAAIKALVKWSPAFKRKHDLNKAYEGPSPVESSDLEVNGLTPLFVGQILQAQEHGHFWNPARIKNLRSDGKVEVEFLAWGKTSRSAVLTRRNLQLAPPEVDQPAKPYASSTKGEKSTAGKPNPKTAEGFPGGLRTWSDATGRFKVEAEFISAEGGTVSLRRADGRTVNLPMEKLSPTDQRIVRTLIDELAKAENPFEPK